MSDRAFVCVSIHLVYRDGNQRASQTKFVISERANETSEQAFVVSKQANESVKQAFAVPEQAFVVPELTNETVE